MISVELIGIFGADCLTFLEANLKIERPDSYYLPLAAGQMHFDSAMLLVVDCSMLKPPDLKVAPKLAIYSRQQIQIERRRYAQRIIVSRYQHIARFLEIGAQQQGVPGT